MSTIKASTDLLGQLTDFVLNQARVSPERLNIEKEGLDLPQTYEGFAQLLRKLERLVTLFGPGLDLIRSVKFVTGLQSNFEIREEESKTEVLTHKLLILDPRVVTDDHLLNTALESQCKQEVEQYANNFIESINRHFDQLPADVSIHFKQFKYGGKCPASLLQALKHQPAPIAALSIVDMRYFDQQFLAYLAGCEVLVNFSVQADKHALFCQTIRDYFARNNQLSVTFTHDGEQFQLCRESYLPLIHKSFTTVHRQYFCHLKVGQPDISIFIDFSGLLTRLQSLDSPLDQLSTLKEQQSGSGIVNDLKYMFEELRFKAISLQGCFASKSKSDVRYNQLRGILICFNEGETLQLTTIDEEIADKGSNEYNAWSTQIPKMASPFESKMVPKNYNSKVARLTVRFD